MVQELYFKKILITPIYISKLLETDNILRVTKEKKDVGWGRWVKKVNYMVTDDF